MKIDARVDAVLHIYYLCEHSLMFGRGEIEQSQFYDHIIIIISFVYPCSHIQQSCDHRLYEVTILSLLSPDIRAPVQNA